MQAILHVVVFLISFSLSGLSHEKMKMAESLDKRETQATEQQASSAFQGDHPFSSWDVIEIFF